MRRMILITVLSLIALDVIGMWAFIRSSRRAITAGSDAKSIYRASPSESERRLTQDLDFERRARRLAEMEATSMADKLRSLEARRAPSGRSKPVRTQTAGVALNDRNDTSMGASESRIAGVAPPTIISTEILADRTTAAEAILSSPPPVSPPVSTITATAPADQEECAPNKPCQIKVFFATDRKLEKPENTPSKFRSLKYYFGGNRELESLPATGFRLGECIVTIPETTYQKFSGKLDYGDYNPDTSIYVQADKVFANADDWLRSLNQRVDADHDHEAFVFIHGFNVTFVDAARRTAQIYYDLGFKGAPIFYSWPSGGNLWNYWADEASIEWSAAHLREFLDFVAERSHAKTIHLIAHSMGNRALTHALAEIGARNAKPQPADCPTKPAHFQQVILAAPDLDTDLFLQLESAVKSASDRVTLYASRRDRAMLASWILHRFRRLGFPSGPTPPPGIDAIDASSASHDFLGHSYYGESVLWDIKMLFAQPDLEMAKRCTLAHPSKTSYFNFLVPLSAPTRIRHAIQVALHKPKPEVITMRTCTIFSSDPGAAK